MKVVAACSNHAKDLANAGSGIERAVKGYGKAATA